jgi:hypothetical protein
MSREIYLTDLLLIEMLIDEVCFALNVAMQRILRKVCPKDRSGFRVGYLLMKVLWIVVLDVIKRAGRGTRRLLAPSYGG